MTLTWCWSIAIACRTHPALRAALPPRGSKKRAAAYLVLRVCLSFCCPLNFFFLQPSTRACLCYPFLFAAPINDTTASWFSFQNKMAKENSKSRSRENSVYEPALSLAQSRLSLFLWIHLHNSASPGFFCPCFSESTCTAQPVWVSSVLVALHPPAHFVPPLDNHQHH